MSARRDRIDRILRRGLAAQRRAYDPERRLVATGPADAAGRRPFRTSQSVWFAHALLREAPSDSAGAVREVAAILDAALTTQERASQHPHRGNFLWLAGDAEVVDLNAIQFMFRALIPLLVEHAERLPADLVERCREALRLGLHEQERMAVAPTYTNIHLMSLFSLVVGGEWLGDERFLALGRERWDAWVAFTAASGAPHEYNSPGYGAVDLSALAAIHQYARDSRIKLQARLFYERLWLHLALHLHRPTGLHAGPHCRSYWQMMIGGRSGLHDLLWRETGRTFAPDDAKNGTPAEARIPVSEELALTNHWLPDVVRVWLERQHTALPAEVRETSNRAEGHDLTTYLSPSYALGTASRTYTIGQDDFYIEHQANHLALHYARPGGWGMLYSRYVVNDRHFGMLTAAPDRPANAFYDQGHFAGVQRRNKAIALYTLKPQHEEVFSLKTVVSCRQSGGGPLDEIWVGKRRVAFIDLPASLSRDEWLVIADGGVFIGVRPLEPSCLGREAPITLERGPDGELWLTIYNYRGAAKRFWDYASLRGAFWRGNVRAGFIVEIGERRDYPSVDAFLEHVRKAVVTDTIESAADSPLVRTVTYRSGEDVLELRYDLWLTRPLERRLNGAAYVSPGLESPIAAQGSDGALRAGSAALHTARQPHWLIAQELDPTSRTWVAVNPQDVPSPLRLETPLGEVTAARWGVGQITLHAAADGEPTLIVDTLAEPIDLRVPSGVRVVRGGRA